MIPPPGDEVLARLRERLIDLDQHPPSFVCTRESWTVNGSDATVEGRAWDRGSVILFLKPAAKHAGVAAAFSVLPLLDDLARGEAQLAFSRWAAIQKRSLTAVYRLDRHVDIYLDRDSREISEIRFSRADTPDHAQIFCQIQR